MIEHRTITGDNFREVADRLPLDMRTEVDEALMFNYESLVEYRRTWDHNDQPTHYAFFPNLLRGGVCDGGNTDWTDCTSMEDLVDRWENYQERWSN